VSRLRHPPTTVRWRLTLLYGGLILVSGAILLAITYVLVAHATVSTGPQYLRRGTVPANAAFPANARSVHQLGGSALTKPAGLPPALVKAPPAIQKLLTSRNGQVVIRIVGRTQRISDLHQLIIESIIALAIMAVLSTALGWVIAGRVLQPLRSMTATTREISEASLHQRLAMTGPRDELRELGDTIDGLLGRLEGAFEGQRRFVANASHELRTPLTAARALLEMVIGDPDATVDTFRVTCRQVLEESEQQEQLIDALLALAHGQRGVERLEPVDLADVVDRVLSSRRAELAGLTVRQELDSVTVSADARLLERLVSNLVDNAIRHNRTGGEIAVTTGATATGTARLSVANTGERVPANEIPRLLQPFQRLNGDRIGHTDGLGLGLSIVTAIADAHHATLLIVPGDDGGLEVDVRFTQVQTATGWTPDPNAQVSI
jgi:signal transduction histidine kinase